MKAFISVVLAVIVYTVPYCQPYESSQITFYANGAIPIGEFKNAVRSDNGAFGIGAGMSAVFNPKGKNEYFPLFIGGDFTYIYYGRDKQPAINGLPPFKTSFNYYGISALSRLFLSAKPSGVIPFIDGQVGLNIVNARTKVDKDLLQTVLGDDFPEVLNNADDLGLMYGIGLGIYTRKPYIEERGRNPSFFFKTTYLGGDAVNHVKRGTIQVVNGEVIYQTTSTKVNNIVVQLGITFPI